MRIDLVILLAMAAVAGGIIILFTRGNGNGGVGVGNGPRAYPSSPVTGGWVPGGYLYRNQGVGGSSPEVWAQIAQNN